MLGGAQRLAPVPQSDVLALLNCDNSTHHCGGGATCYWHGLVNDMPRLEIDWSRFVQIVAQYMAPGLVALTFVIEITADGFRTAVSYNYLITIIYSILTVTMIGLCGWILFLWDLDRLFFSLERKIDAQATAGTDEADGSVVGWVRDAIASKLGPLRAQAVGVIEKAYWEDINAGGVLAFPRPDIAQAVASIDESRRDLLAPLGELVARTIPVGNAPAKLVSRVLFRYLAPDVKARLYRRLILRFLTQLGALFALASVCFYLSLLGWSRMNATVFASTSVTAVDVMLYQMDLMLRGALFDFMEHTHRSVSPITINQRATTFVYYTLAFRIFVAAYFISSVFRVARFVARRWRVLLR